MNINVLRQGHADEKAKAAAIHKAAADANRAMTGEELATYNGHVATAKNYAENIKAEESRLEAERSAPAVDAQVGHNNAEDKPWASLGEQMKAVKEYGQSHGRKRDERLFATALGQNETIDSEGGFAIAPEFAPGLLTRTYEGGLVTSRCRQRPMAGPRLVLNGVDDANRIGGPLGAGVLVMRAAEAASVNFSKLKFRRVELNANKLMGFYAATDEILDDAPALQAELEDYFPEAFAWVGDNEVLNGTGDGQPLGVNTSGATVVAQVPAAQLVGGASPATFTTANALAMNSRLWVRSRANAAWFVGPDVEDQLYSLTIPGEQGTAVALYTPAGVGSNQSNVGRMLGKPVIVIEQTANAGTQGDVLLADMSEYLIGTRKGVNFASSIHVQFLTDQQVFRWTLRNDGAPRWDKPVTQNNSANKVSPFVVLQGGRPAVSS